MELWNEEMNAKMIIATYEVAKKKGRKIQAWQNWKPDLCNK